MSPARRAIPQVTGGFDLLRGSLTLIGQRLVFTRGQVRFHGDVIPDLDLVAETTASGHHRAHRSDWPRDPTEPSRSLRSQACRRTKSCPAFSSSGRQAVCPASRRWSWPTPSRLFPGNVDAFEGLRKTLGVDSLDISTSATGGALVGATRAINDRISVGVTTGARPWDNGVNVDLDVTRHLRLQAGVDASGGSSAGVGAEWEYK